MPRSEVLPFRRDCTNSTRLSNMHDNRAGSWKRARRSRRCSPQRVGGPQGGNSARSVLSAERLHDTATFGPRVIKDCPASTLHGNIVRLRFELMGRPGRYSHPPTPRRPDQKSLQTEATTCIDPGSLDCPGFFSVAVKHQFLISLCVLLKDRASNFRRASGRQAVG